MPAPYTVQPWTDGVTPVDKAHMDHIEAGIASADDSLTYRGDYAAGTTYYDGDVVVAADGFAYICVKDGVVGSAPVAFPGSNGGVPLPVVNGQWIKGVGGAAVWSAIAPADIAGYPADATKFLRGDAAWVAAPGQELAYAQIVATANITDTAEATATALITAPPITVDGVTPIIVEFFAEAVSAPSGAAGNALFISLFEGATQITRLVLTTCQVTGVANYIGGTWRYRFTPTSGAHTYKITGFVPNTTGTPAIAAGPGGLGTTAPAFIRITRAA